MQIYFTEKHESQKITDNFQEHCNTCCLYQTGELQ